MPKLHFYYSAMNAGKSTTLLQSSHNYNERGMQTILFSPEIDTRYQIGTINSRIGIQANAVNFTSDFDFFQYVSNQLQTSMPNLRCVLLDEAQFLTKAQVLQLTDICDKLNLPVLAYGLRSDFRGEPFEGSLYLLALAEEINEIKTICHCGRKATMNMRINADGQKALEGEQIEIGGNERYIATCRKHYKQGEVLQPAATKQVVAEEEI